MRGTASNSGKAIDGLEHLRQSIRDILTTPIGSRVMRRDYGSRLFELLDSPLTAGSLALFSAATAEALSKWEPRFLFEALSFADSTPSAGAVVLTITGKHVADGSLLTLDVALG